MKFCRSEKWNNALKCFVVTEWVDTGRPFGSKPCIRYPNPPKRGVRCLYVGALKSPAFFDTPEEARTAMVEDHIAAAVLKRLLSEEEPQWANLGLNEIIIDELQP